MSHPVFRVVEPLHGRTVTLDGPTWHRHILRHHPEMAPLLHEIQQAIVQPDVLLYHRRLPGKRLMTCVTVRFVQERKDAPGFVRTAHLTHNLRGGEVI